MKVLYNKDNKDNFEYFFQLTPDNWYNVISEDSKFYRIFCDLGYTSIFDKNVFLTEKEVRKLKIIKLNEKM